MKDEWTKCDDCPPEKFIEEIEACGFECIMGDLKDHRGWIALKKRVANLQALFKSNCKVESIAIAKYAESQKRVAELEKFARHSGACASIYSNDKCDCGYDETLSRKDGD